MTDRIAYALAAALALLLAADLAMGWGAGLALARKVAVFIDYLAFWR